MPASRKGRSARPRPRATSKEKPRPSAAANRRLDRELNLWLATEGPKGQPHLVPVWFVSVDAGLFVCTDPRSVKVANIRRRPHVTAALEGGDHPVIVRGQAKIVSPPWPPDVLEQFRRKYDWDITSDGTYSCLVEIRPSRWIEW